MWVAKGWDPMIGKTTLLSTAFAALSCGLLACAPSGGAPEFDALDDQVAAVGAELVLVVKATDPEGEKLVYSFSSEVPNILNKARISQLPNGASEFRWTPTAEDIGVWYFDFSASDGDHKESVTIQIDVRSAVGANTAPKFLRPDGMGTTLDLERDSCVELEIAIEDTDTATVEIAQAVPTIEFSNLQPEGPHSAIWRWCPKEAQIAADDRYMLRLTADDSDNPMTVHPYLIVLRKPVKQNCPGAAPVITHTPQNESSLVGLTLAAQVSDAEGLRREPLLYWSTTQPATPPDLAAMTQQTMLLIDGDMRSGTWAADVPNPVVADGAGTSKELYYVIVADDDDDTVGDCDHRTESTVFQMTVTNPGGVGGADVCEPCTEDIQCGGNGDLCARVGTGSGSFCLKACTADSECPTDYSCSPDPIESVGGNMGRQCVPNSGDCADPGGNRCVDDEREDNDSHFDAFFMPLFEPGSESLISCPSTAGFGDDEDWIEIQLAGEAMVEVKLTGGSSTDLDLALYNDDGDEIGRSGSLSSSETVSACLTEGFYAMRVFAWGAEENAYTLTYTKVDGPCGATTTCEADSNEPDSDMSQARLINTLPHDSTTNSICEADEDWFDVFMITGEKLVVDLTFEQSDGTGDLDIHVHDSAGVDLTPCSPDAVTECDTSNGQSGTSNEHLERDIDTTGVYYVVVKGFDADDTNLYDIHIEAQ